MSEALRIRAKMRRDRHIDPDLFERVLTSGVHRRYAELYLRADQIDAVDIASLLAAA